MNCSKCGKEIADDSKFCEYCGTKVKKAKSRKPFWIVLALCVIALFVGIIIYYENKLDSYRYYNYDEEVCCDTTEVEPSDEEASCDTVVSYYYEYNSAEECLSDTCSCDTCCCDPCTCAT